MSALRCFSCHQIFDTDFDPDCWFALTFSSDDGRPERDAAVCETCREDGEPYQAMRKFGINMEGVT